MQCGAHAHGTRQHGEGCGHVFEWSQAPRYQASMAMAEEKRQPPGFSAILAWVMQQLDRHFESFVGFIVHLNMCKWKMTFRSDLFPFRKICLILLFFPDPKIRLRFLLHSGWSHPSAANRHLVTSCDHQTMV